MILGLDQNLVKASKNMISHKGMNNLDNSNLNIIARIIFSCFPIPYDPEESINILLHSLGDHNSPFHYIHNIIKNLCVIIIHL